LGGPDEEEEKVPLEEVLEPDEEQGEEIITITDDIPFLSGNRNQSQNQKRRATS
jgi:hypothetical protein